MKTKFFLLSLLIGFSVHLFAQETRQAPESKLPGFKTAFKHNKAGDNWFINISGGGQVYNITDKVEGVNLTDRIGFIPALSIGKWFSPYWGVRLKGEGLTVNSYYKDTGFKQPNDYSNVHLDAMWNLANYWGVYSPKKVFNFTPYVGIGWAHRFKLSDTDAGSPKSTFFRSDFRRMSDDISINPGIQFGFRLSNHVNLDFDLGVTYVGDYFDRINSRALGATNNNIVHAMGGFTFNLGKTTFEVVEPMDYGLINDLNSKINALRGENAELSKRPKSCPDCPPCPPATPVIKNEINYVPNVVFFRLNSSKIDPNQQISVFNTATFMKETAQKITVIGYADKGTGTSKINMALSEKRAKAVAKELTTKYNIPSQNISVEWKGSEEQPYPQNNWNRVVIMSAPNAKK
jgi:outer membrane protein OmpA-like peptidoglycan-associated protein